MIKLLKILQTVLILFAILIATSIKAEAQTTVFNHDKDLWAWKGDNYVSIMWEFYGEAVYYDIYRLSLEEGNLERINNEPLIQTKILDYGSNLSGDYEYFVQVRGEDGGLIYETGPLLIEDIDQSSKMELTQTLETIEELRQHITTDLEFRNNLAMTEENIQNFLETANSFLADFVTQDASGIERLASEIIFNAANENGINPQSILTTLQKEQGLISTLPGDATQHQLDWAMGYAVGNEMFRGFGNQVDRAAWQFDKYYSDMETTGTTVSGWGVLIAKGTEDCLIITPRNMATAALYTYTPLAGVGWGGCTPFGGNFLYWDLFYNRYRFDAGPEGDFEPTNQSGIIGCTISGKNNSLSFGFNIAIFLLPALLVVFRNNLRRS